MNITVRDIDTDAPLQGVPVSVDGGSPQSTDSNGLVSAPDGNTIKIPGVATFVFSESGDRELWIEGISATNPPPPMPLPPLLPPPPLPPMP